MIARMWKGSALPEKADEYVKHLELSVLPELRQIVLEIDGRHPQICRG